MSSSETESLEAGTAPDDDVNRRAGARGTVAAALVPALVLALVIALVGALWLSRDRAPKTPSADGPEAGFARDMQVHHAQAVEMAFLIRDRSDNPVIDTLAYDIATAQQQQIGQMFGWLEVWGLSQTSTAEPMAWMTGMSQDDMSSGMRMGPYADGRMPGMASARDLARLERADGVNAERIWLGLMIAHHRAGVDMARAVLGLTDQPPVRDFATAMVAAQTAEIAQMRDLLAERTNG